MRTFVLRRTEDASGVSGTGDVAEGIEFSDGTTVLRWLRAGGSTAVYDSLTRMEAIHGHDGRTTVVWVRETPPGPLDALIDVQRLSRALHGVWPRTYGNRTSWSQPSFDMAVAIAREYERLTPASPSSPEAE